MNIVDRAKQALWKKAGLPHDCKGYVTDPQINLIADVTSEMIKGDYASGNGQEWLSKIRAIHSSSALAANTFGRWKSVPTQLTFGGFSGFTALKLEAKCYAGLRGMPPNLDVLLQSADAVFGIESKLLEPLRPTVPKFAASYSRDRLPLCEDAHGGLFLNKSVIGPLRTSTRHNSSSTTWGFANNFPPAKMSGSYTCTGDLSIVPISLNILGMRRIWRSSDVLLKVRKPYALWRWTILNYGTRGKRI